MEKNYLQLNQITAYTKSFHLSNFVWDLVSGWDSFAKYTIGQQFVDAVDSISAILLKALVVIIRKIRSSFIIIALVLLRNV